MARKSKNNNVLPPVYYAFYDEQTTQITSVSNEPPPQDVAGIVISYEQFDRFVSGVDKFHNYAIGYIKTPDNKTVLSIIPTGDQDYVFKNNLFEWIVEKPDDETELTVIWNKPTKSWCFRTSASSRTRLSSALAPKNLLFFVMLQDDFDFLIQTIEIPTENIISNDIEMPFISKFEENINEITISSKLFFESYGLLVNE